MKDLLKYFSIIFLSSFLLVGFVYAAFPTSLHNFISGGIIHSQDINEIEYAIGEVGTTSASTIQYKLNWGNFTAATSTYFSATNATTSALEVTAGAKFKNLDITGSIVGNLTINKTATSSGLYVTSGTRLGSLMVNGLGGSGTRCLQADNNGLLSVAATSCAIAGISNISGLTNSELSIQGTANQITVATSSVTNTFTFSIPSGLIVTNATSSALSVTAGTLLKTLEVSGSILGTFDATSATFKTLYGTNPTVNSNGQIAIDSTTGQLLFQSDNTFVVSATSSKSFVIASTTALVGGENDIPLWFTPEAITIRQITCIVDPTESGQSISVIFYESNTSGAYSSTIDTITCNNTGVIDTAQADAAIAANVWVGVRLTSAPTGSPRKLQGTFIFTTNRQ